MSFTPSPENLAIKEHICSDSAGNLMVIAVAGSGKTTTIIWVLDFIPNAQSKSICFMAFAKPIVVAMKEKVPAWMKDNIATGHSLGFSAWKRHTNSRFNMDTGKDKVFNIIKDLLKSEQDFNLYSAPIRRLVGFAKNAGMGTHLLENEFSSWYQLISYNNIILDDAADEQRLVELSMDVLERSNVLGRTVIDFDDMLYLPLLHNCSFDKKNFIFIDEAQDTNSVQRELIKRMLALGVKCEYCNGEGILVDPDYCLEREEDDDPDASDHPCHKCNGTGRIGAGRLIAVGDPSQAIYGFRGADSDAMTALRDEFNMTVMPLSVSYRCSRAVVAEAQKYESKF